MSESTGLGTKFYRESDVTAGTYDRVASVASITLPGLQRDTIEIEDLDPPDALKQKRLGLIDAGEFGLTLNFDPGDASHQLLEADLDAALSHNYKVELPSGDFYIIEGTVIGFVPQEITAGTIIQAEATLKVESKPTYTPATP